MIVTKINKFIDTNGVECYVPCVLYHIQKKHVRIFSPRNYHHMHGEHSLLHGFKLEMFFPEHHIVITIENQKDNLPLVQNYQLT